MDLTVLSRRSFLSVTLQSLLSVSIATRAKANAQKTSLILAMSIEPPNLDPTAAAPVSIGMVTWNNIFEGLVTIDPHGRIQPQLATEWTISPDDLVYTFKLRKNVVFHNGTPFEASVAKFSIDRARDPESGNPQNRFFTQIDQVEAPDPFTLTIRLKRRNSSLLYWLGWPASVIVAPDSAETNATTPIGTGPFRFASWSRGRSITLDVNEDYRNRSEIALRTVTFMFMNDVDALAGALKAKEIDAVPEFISPDRIAELQQDPTLKAVIGISEMKVVAGMNNSRRPFNDIRVRQALMMAVDRSAIITGAWGGLGTEIGSHYTPNDRAYRNLTKVYPYNPMRAKALLAEAGYPKGFSFTMKVPQMLYAVRCSDILQAAFAEIGVTMHIKSTFFPEAWTREVFDQADYDMTIIAHAEPMDIGIFAQANSYFRYDNPEFRKLIQDIEQSADEREQDNLYVEAQATLARDVPALFLFALPKIGVWNAKLKGMWENEPISSNVLSQVYWQD